MRHRLCTLFTILAFGTTLFAQDEPVPTDSSPDTVVVLTVRLPADAELELHGRKTSDTGETRRFELTPSSLEDGTPFTLKARWKEDGELREIERNIAFTHEKTVEVDLHWPATIYIGGLKPLPFPGTTEIRITFDIGGDGTIFPHKAGWFGEDKDGKVYEAQKVKLDGKEVIAFLGAPFTGDPPKPAEKQDEPTTEDKERPSEAPAHHQPKNVKNDEKTQSNSIPSSGRERQPVKLIVRLPADAKLELEGQEAQTKGELRPFQIPPIPTGTDSQYHLNASWKEDGEQRTVSRTFTIRGGQRVEIDLRRPVGWPAYSGELAGNQEVRVKNPNDFIVTVGMRSQGRGKDFVVPANSSKSVYVPNGQCEIYFQYSTDPDGLYQGDNFTLADNGVEIQIVKIVDGNYGIRKVN